MGILFESYVCLEQTTHRKVATNIAKRVGLVPTRLQKDTHWETDFHNATVTPHLLHASGKWTMTGKMKKNLQTTEERTHRPLATAKRYILLLHANVDDVARAASHNPDSESEEDATDANPQRTQREGRKQPRRRQHPLLQQRATR